MNKMPFVLFFCFLCGFAFAERAGWEYDQNMIQPVATDVDGFDWYEPVREPFRLSGFPWFKQEKIYRRLPQKPRLQITEAVDRLANNASGGTISFRTDAEKMAIRVELRSTAGRMNHMAATGESGMDLYYGAPGDKKFLATARPANRKTSYSITFNLHDPGKMKELTLHFPLYNGVKSLRLGLPPKSRILPPTPYADKGKVVVYGGSTVQGACASRPGRACTNIMARKLNREVVNLGFSGSGKMEIEMAELIADIPDLAMVMIEAERNTGIKGMKKKLEPFILKLRARHPKLPIVVWSANPRAEEYVSTFRRKQRQQYLEIMRSTVDKLSKNDPSIYLFDSSSLLGENYYECTVDGIHPTDLGFYRMAEGITPFVKNILDKSKL